ncbi:MAG: DUF5689 domain-containing protein [Rikenellaceae bacterium]
MWRILLLFSLLFGACSPSEVSPEIDQISIVSLKQLHLGSTISITGSCAIRGTVIANDLYGELSSAMVIDDGSAAIELRLELDKIYNYYPIGCQVTLYCQGLYLGEDLLGAEPSDGDEVSELSEELIWRYISTTGQEESLNPISTTIDVLSEAMAKRLVSIDDLEFLPHEATENFCERSEESGKAIYTTHTLQDQSGEPIKLQVSGTVDYADTPLPTGQGSITAIVERYGSGYALRIVNRGFYF